MSSNALPRPENFDPASLVAELRPALIRFFRRRRMNGGEAEDLAQDVIVRALAQAGWSTLDQARGYIFRAAVNRLHDHRRRRISHGTAVEWDEESEQATREEISPERVVLTEDELFRVAAALQELSERTRDIFLLHRLEQMTYAQIAEGFAISISAVEKHMSKALGHLTARIDDRHDT